MLVYTFLSPNTSCLQKVFFDESLTILSHFLDLWLLLILYKDLTPCQPMGFVCVRLSTSTSGNTGCVRPIPPSTAVLVCWMVYFWCFFFERNERTIKKIDFGISLIQSPDKGLYLLLHHWHGTRQVSVLGYVELCETTEIFFVSNRSLVLLFFWFFGFLTISSSFPPSKTRNRTQSKLVTTFFSCPEWSCFLVSILTRWISSLPV